MKLMMRLSVLSEKVMKYGSKEGEEVKTVGERDG